MLNKNSRNLKMTTRAKIWLENYWKIFQTTRLSVFTNYIKQYILKHGENWEKLSSQQANCLNKSKNENSVDCVDIVRTALWQTCKRILHTDSKCQLKIVNLLLLLFFLHWKNIYKIGVFIFFYFFFQPRIVYANLWMLRRKISNTK